VVMLVGSQALATTFAPSDGTASTGRSIGRAGFAYFGGLRTFAAAVLWNRLEPQFHEYYQGVALDKQSFAMPTLRLVTILDPQFQQAYYIAAWISFKRVGHAEGIAIARAGIESNPTAGLMHANLVQLLYLDDPIGHRREMIDHVNFIIAAKAQWKDANEYYEGLAVCVDPLKSVGETELAASVSDQLEQMRGQGLGAGSHDHDGDGQQDH